MEIKIRSGNPCVYGCNPGIVLLFKRNDTSRIKCKINSGKARTGKQTVFSLETEVLHGKNHSADNREKTGWSVMGRAGYPCGNMAGRHEKEKTENWNMTSNNGLTGLSGLGRRSVAVPAWMA